MNATVVKVGGSIASFPERLRSLCSKLSEISKKHRLIVIPGGGEFADVVRNLDKMFFLSCSVTHKMAILSMDQYGLMLSDLTPNSVTIGKLEEIKSVLDSGRLPVFLPSKLFFDEDPLENSWNVTSDSIAAYIAYRLNVSRVLLVTDVDGIYTDDPKTNPKAKLIKKISANELLDMNERTSVDSALPKLLFETPIDYFVVNGLFPERVEAVLDGHENVYTLIKMS